MNNNEDKLKYRVWQEIYKGLGFASIQKKPSAVKERKVFDY